MYHKYFKHLLDILIALPAFFLLLPVLLLIALLIRINMGTPVLFIQERPGLNEKIFKLYKFRTMTFKKDKNNNLISDDERITQLGKFLRKTSMDELPELYNILKGDMSLVGPRPLLIEYLPFYNKEQSCRHELKPGITGWAQVKGRNSISWEEKFNLDIYYLNHITFLFDMKILFMTIWKVFIHEGISSGTTETMEKFTGTNK